MHEIGWYPKDTNSITNSIMQSDSKVSLWRSNFSVNRLLKDFFPPESFYRLLAFCKRTPKACLRCGELFLSNHKTLYRWLFLLRNSLLIWFSISLSLSLNLYSNVCLFCSFEKQPSRVMAKSQTTDSLVFGGRFRLKKLWMLLGEHWPANTLVNGQSATLKEAHCQIMEIISQNEKVLV